jgi:hypothetical protein
MARRTAVALAIIVPVVGAATWVSAAQDAPDPIRACVQHGSGQIRIVSSAERCHRHERAIEWNEGAVGAPGPKGEPGPAGATGPAGPPGVSGWEQVVSAAVSLAAGTTKAAVARCPAGKQVFGGGFTSPGAGAVVVESRPVFGPVNGNTATTPGWVAWARNPSGPDTTLTAYALCATAT